MRTGVVIRTCVRHALSVTICLVCFSVADSQERSTFANGGGISVNGVRQMRGSVGHGFYLKSQNGPILRGGFGVLTVSVRDWEVDPVPKLRIAPNPTSHVIHISSSPAYEWTRLTMTDVVGREYVFDTPLADGESNDWSIDVSSVPTGWYVVNVIGERHSLTTSLIIIR